MKKQEFFQELMRELGDFPGTEKEQMREYFEEIILDGQESGKTEDEVIEALGSPKEVSERLRSEYGQLERYQRQELSRDKDSSGEQEKVEEHQEIHSVSVQAENVRICVKPGVGPYARVSYKPMPDLESYTVREEDGKLLVEQKFLGTGIFRGLLFFKNYLEKVMTVELPEGFQGDLEIKTTNAGVTVERLNDLTDCVINSTNAQVAVEQVSAERVKVKTSNGLIRLRGIEGRDILMETTNGKVLIQDVTAAGLLQVESSNGLLDVKGITGKEISLKTSNGAVKGVIKGRREDYNISSYTKNGINNMPSKMNSAAEKFLNVETRNGMIQIGFSEG